MEGPATEIPLQELYPLPPGPAALFPDGADSVTIDDVAQGAHPDCYFIASCVAVAHNSPQTIMRLFKDHRILIPEPASETRAEPEEAVEEPIRGLSVTLQFWKETAWRDAVVDARVAVSASGSPLYAQSPTRKWWPLLLERAYSAQWPSFAARDGGNIAEALRDLTAQPVVSHGIPIEGGTAAWLDIGAMLRSKRCAAVAGTRASFARDVGLQPRHAYAVLGVLDESSVKGNAAAKASPLVVLRNPNVKQRYTGPPKVTPALLEAINNVTKGGKGVPGGEGACFVLPLTVMNEFFNSLHLCKLLDNPQVLMPLSWGEAGSGGCIMHGRGFQANPMFILSPANGCENTGSDTVWITVSHSDKRCVISGVEKVSYEPCGVTILRSAAKGALLPPRRELMVQNLVRPVGTALFRNQRDVTLELTLAGGEKGCALPLVVVPSTHQPSESVPCVLSFVSATGRTRLHKLDGTECSISSAVELPALDTGSSRCRLACSISWASEAKGAPFTLWLLLSQPSNDQKDKTAGPFYLGATIEEADLAASFVAVNYAQLALASKPFTPSVEEREKTVLITVRCARAIRSLEGVERVTAVVMLQAASGAVMPETTLNLSVVAEPTNQILSSQHQQQKLSPQPPATKAPPKREMTRNMPSGLSAMTVARKATGGMAALYRGI
jgi:hypothetical protein